MHSAQIEIEVDLPVEVTLCGYERHQGAHAFEVDFDLPPRSTCPKCGREAETNLRQKNDVLAIRDLDLYGSPASGSISPTGTNVRTVGNARKSLRPSSGPM